MSLRSQWNAKRDVRRETDIPDLGRLDSDAAQDELPFDDLSGARVDDLSFAGEGGDRALRAAEHADEFPRELRRRGRGRRRGNLRLVACGTDAVAVDVLLIGIGRAHAVVAKV